MTDMTLAPEPGSHRNAASVISYRLGGRNYPLKTVAGCSVCFSSWRYEIEQHLIQGHPYRSIVESLFAQDASFDIRVSEIRGHYSNGHMPLQEALTRKIVERRAQERGMHLEEATESLVDGLAVAEVVVKQGFEALARGELRPSMKDVLVAAKMLEDYGQAGAGIDMDLMSEAFLIYHETAQRLMAPEVFAEFGRQLSENPVLQALISRADGEHAPVAGKVESNDA